MGLIIRSYNKAGKAEEDVAKDIRRAAANAKKATAVTIDGSSIFEKVLFVVPTDHDYGGTARQLRAAFEGEGVSSAVSVFEAKGHHSCGALNEGMQKLRRGGCHFGVIISGKAIDYLTSATMRAMVVAFADGAKVVGVATDELAEIVEVGRIQNTFGGYDLEALFSVDPPGFDAENGVEEYAPVARIIRKYGNKVAVLRPSNLPPLDIRNSADGKARHEEVMRTKDGRQQAEADRVGMNFDEVKVGIMPGYPKSV